jgi:ferredoxin
MWTPILFSILFFGSLGSALYQFKQVLNQIKLGKPFQPKGKKIARLKNVLLIALGQSKMFKKWLPAIFHGFIYLAFLITQIELIEIIIDGFTGSHRFFFSYYHPIWYPWIINFIEILSFLAFIATIIFMVRRNILSISRFQKNELKGWPKRDGNLILIFEILLIMFIFLMNSADMAMKDKGFWISGWMSTFLMDLPMNSLFILERIGWWGHFIMVMVFLNYLPFSKHLHILFAFPNTYYTDIQPIGKIENMPVVMNEVRGMLGIEKLNPPENHLLSADDNFGAKDITDLSRKTILEAFSCTECGRCTDVCPANITGKKLSPRKIMMDIRDRTNQVYRNRDHPSGSLFDFIDDEEIFACTTCNACVEACPVMINPLKPILELRRYKILSESSGPNDWIAMFNSLENGQSVWAINESRTNWIEQ